MVHSKMCLIAVATASLLTTTSALAQVPVTTTIHRSSTVSAGTPIPVKPPVKEARPATASAVKPVGQTKPAPAKTPQKSDETTTQQTTILRGNTSSNAPKISAWTQQNPSGIQNRQPVDGWNGAPQATNNYFGPQFRNWNGMSAPVAVQRMPAEYSTPTPLSQSNLMLAPNTWYGPQAATWTNMRSGTAVADPRGGYSYRVER